ncbi:hypothetical protein V2S66_08355 [Streptomyces sp. V4-01]|uniref:Uncharacterized protein n=1 Tax=Actinacidiphila polyblastidii TaxID=3110430 RepID=A0ABU7P852_9ACTN|nr:hypothetical protein [Streptomyces sp. V4-01]
MTITEAVTAQQPAPAATAPAVTGPAVTPAAEKPAEYKPIPVAFFAFEGLIGASYDILKTSSYAWVVIAIAIATNIALARTVLRGRLKTARAMLKGRRTRKLAVGLIALRVGVHFVFGAIGVAATSPAAHLAFAVAMCATTVALLAFDQKVMLRALDAEAARASRAAQPAAQAA